MDHFCIGYISEKEGNQKINQSYRDDTHGKTLRTTASFLSGTSIHALYSADDDCCLIYHRFCFASPVANYILPPPGQIHKRTVDITAKHVKWEDPIFPVCTPPSKGELHIHLWVADARPVIYGRCKNYETRQFQTKSQWRSHGGTS